MNDTITSNTDPDQASPTDGPAAAPVGPWVDFWFTGNHGWGWVRDQAQWRTMVARYEVEGWTKNEILDKARRSEHVKHPKFGFSGECNGTQTLREFFAQHGMTP